MQKQYDDFVKLKVKEMSRTISKLTYTYLDPDTKKATVVPASHYEKWLNQNKEETIDQAIQYQFLNVIYTQIKNLKTENPRYFQEALLCLDLNLKPTDMAVDEQLALTATSVMMNMEEETKKKKFHLLDSSFIEYFTETKESPEVQSKLLQLATKNQDKELLLKAGVLEEVKYYSNWDNGAFIIGTKALLNVEDGSITDIESVDPQGVTTLDKEYIVRGNGEEYEVIYDETSGRYEAVGYQRENCMEI